MTPSQITQIILRLFALSWFIQGIAQAIVGLITDGSTGFQLRISLPGLLTAVIACILWFVAPFISARITKHNDHANVLGTISLFELLVAMFIGLGLFFCLSSVGSIINWLWFLSVTQADPKIIPTGMSYQNILKEGITFGAGLFVIFTSQQWATKIINKIQRTDRLT